MKKEKVVIEEFEELFYLYGADGGNIEGEFETYEEAEEYALDNEYEIVQTFINGIWNKRV